MVFLFVASTGRRRGNGRGRGSQPVAGITFDRNGAHAREILQGYLSNDPNFLTWDAFKSHKNSWIISATNPGGSYTLDNLRRNYRAVIKRYHDHIDPNSPYDGQFGSVLHRPPIALLLFCSHSCLLLSSAVGNYPDGFLDEAGAPGLPDDNPEGLNFEPGFDPEALGGEGPDPNDPDANPDDDEDNEALPAQVPQAAAAAAAPALDANVELADVEELVQGLARVNMSDFNQDKIPCFPFHAAGVHISGVGLGSDDMSGVEGVCALLGNGVDIQSVDIEIADNLKSFKLEARGAPEMQTARALLPSSIFHRNRPIWNVLRNALKARLTKREVDQWGLPIMRGSGKLEHKVVSKYPLTLDKLGLWEETFDEEGNPVRPDYFLIHKVPIHASRVGHIVPAYVAICFFQQDIDQGVKPKGRFRRWLPGASSPAPSPSSGGSGNKRSRRGPPSSVNTIQMSTDGQQQGTQGQATQGQGMQVDPNASPLSGTDAYMSPLNANDPLANPLNQQPSPDEFSSGLFGFGRTRRTRNTANV